MGQETAITSEMLHGGFMIFCLIMTLFIYALPSFDFRSLAPWRGREDWDNDRRFDIFDRPDLSTIFGVLTIAAVLLGVLLGWRIPMELERIASSVLPFRIEAPDIALPFVARLAQVVGAVCCGLLALRLLRPVMVVAGAAVILALAVAAMGYIIE